MLERPANAAKAKVQITYSHTSKYLNLLPIEHGGLYEVNALAEKMSNFEDWQQKAFDGLVKAIVRSSEFSGMYIKCFFQALKVSQSIGL